MTGFNWADWVTVTVSLLMQFPLEMATLKVPELFTVILLALEPVDQSTCEEGRGFTESVVDCPVQIDVAPVMLATLPGCTVMVTVSCPLEQVPPEALMKYVTS